MLKHVEKWIKEKTINQSVDHFGISNYVSMECDGDVSSSFLQTLVSHNSGSDQTGFRKENKNC